MTSRMSVMQRLEGNQKALNEMASLQGKGRELMVKLWGMITEEKNAYNAALAEYKVNKAQFNQKRSALLDMLNPTKLDILCTHSVQAINDSWTTPGLTRGMRELIKLMNQEFDAVTAAGEDVKKLMAAVYNTFHVKFAFEKMAFPPLDFELARTKLQLVVHETGEFCRDPVNVMMTEKSFLIKRFYNRLVEQARHVFSIARSETDLWLTTVPLPLETQIRDHKNQLQQRLDSLTKINDRNGSIAGEVAKLNAARAELMGQFSMINGLMKKVKEIGPSPE